jgi:flavin-dependent dehydrogenase
MAARAAAERGLSVMIVDRRRSVGMPPRSAGYVPQWIQKLADLEACAILQSVDGIRLYESGEPCREIKAPGYVLDRTRFDKTLAICALQAGADLANALVLRRNGERVVGRRNGLEAEFEGDVILGADGPGSVVGRSIGQVNRGFLATMQYEVGLRCDETWSELHRNGSEGAWTWFVPCNRTARVGVGLDPSQARHLRDRLTRFLGQLADDGRVYRDGILACTGGPVPIDGTPESLHDDRVLLAGDAAGISDPLSGAGIAAAVVSGTIAGSLVGEAFSSGDRARLGDYEGEIKKRIPPFEGYASAGSWSMADRMERVAEWCG